MCHIFFFNEKLSKNDFEKLSYVKTGFISLLQRHSLQKWLRLALKLQFKFYTPSPPQKIAFPVLYAFG